VVGSTVLRKIIRRAANDLAIAVIYSHSHIDHFGGVRGIVSADEMAAGKVTVWAPAGTISGLSILGGLHHQYVRA